MNVSFYPIDHAGLESRWMEFARHTPQRSAYSSYHYARALSEAFGYRCEAAIATKADGEDVAGVLIFSQKTGPFTRVVTPPFTAYSSTMIKADGQSDPESALAKLLASIAGRYDDLRLHLHPSATDVRPFQWQGWRATPLYTYRVSIDTVKDGFDTWSAGTRRTYRKYAESYIFREDPDSIRAVISLCSESYRRQKRTFPVSQDRLESLAIELQNKQMIHVYTISPTAGDPITGGVILLMDEREAYYWVVGSIPGPSMTVLIGRILLHLKEAGCESFDFVGANTPSIAEFKRRFGAVLTPYWAVTHCPNRLLSFAKSLRKSLT